jgi:hypothetical protein
VAFEDVIESRRQATQALAAGASSGDVKLAILIASAFCRYSRMVDGLKTNTLRRSRASACRDGIPNELILVAAATDALGGGYWDDPGIRAGAHRRLRQLPVNASHRACARVPPGSRRCWCSATWAASRKKDSYYKAQFNRLRGRHGAKKAIRAVAASMLTAIYHMLKNGTQHQDLGANYFDHRFTDIKARRLAAHGVAPYRCGHLCCDRLAIALTHRRADAPAYRRINIYPSRRRRMDRGRIDSARSGRSH